MNKLNVRRVLILVLLVGCAGAGGLTSARGETGTADRLIGMPVRTPGGEDIGSIIAVVPGPEGQEAFAVLGYWVFPDTQKRAAVPFGALACEEQYCILKTTRDSLDWAPAFVFEDELVRRDLAEDIYRYFGVQPYWTDEGTKR